MSTRATARTADRLLDALPPLVLVVGKGGVGKTTCAAGLAARAAARGESTLLVATDPAGTLGAALGVSLGSGAAVAVPGFPRLVARQIDAARERAVFLARWRDAIVRIVDRGTYLDPADAAGLVDASLPGADEIFALLAIAEAIDPAASGDAPRAERVIVDTAPTGHTLRLLALPDEFAALVRLLDTMQGKHRFLVRSLTHRYRADDADALIDEMRARVERLHDTLRHRDRTAAVLVAREERIVVAETARYADALAALGVRAGAVLVNDVSPARDAERRAARDALARIAIRVPHFAIAHRAPPPHGVAECAALVAGMRPAARATGAKRMVGGARIRLGMEGGAGVSSLSGGAPRALLRPLTITGGKGGVGKTTASCALAIAAARDATAYPGARILLVSTDPAPSIADALGVGDAHWAAAAPEPVPGVDALDAWQLDAAAAFADFRDRYASRIDELFAALTPRGLDVAHDRAIVRQLLALAPPGIDELHALATLGEILEEGRYEYIVIDPAPTGHLLRLLELPATAMEWSHRLMRLMLQMKEVVPLGDAAEALLLFTRRTRTVEALLRDAARAGVVLVTLDEPLVLDESRRLAAALAARGVACAGTLWNRAPERARVSEAFDSAPLPLVRAPRTATPLVGVAALTAWVESWRESSDALAPRAVDG